MTFNPVIWRRIAIVLSLVNLVGLGQAVGAGEPLHAVAHGALALAFGLWAQRLRQGSAGSEDQGRFEVLDGEMSNLREEVSILRGELTEAQERLDFIERVLAREPESRRLGPDHA